MVLPDPKGIIEKCAIGNSSAFIATIRTATGASRLSVASQLSPSSLRGAKNRQIAWPLLREEYRHLPPGEQIAMIGGLRLGG